jgi:hypothetical protein
LLQPAALASIAKSWRGVAVDCYKHPLRPQCDAIATWLTPARNRMILIDSE